MKSYHFNLSKVAYDKIFPDYRLKTKAHIIEILMEATRFILLQNDSDFIVRDVDAIGKMILYIDKMSRIFFFADKKYYSIVFPFYLLKEKNKYKLIFKSTIEVTPQLISKVISIIHCDEFKKQCSLDFVAPIYDYEDGCDENFWVFLRELLLMENGYIRYDFDKENYDKAVERGEEHKHPLNHYDIFYSSNASFKIGLTDRVHNDAFINLLDINSECEYLIKPNSERITSLK